MLIANGRVGDDKGIDKVTYKNTSTVDYGIATYQLFKYINNFKVHEFNSLYSDVHSAISLNITSNTGLSCEGITHPTNNSKEVLNKWDPDDF